jgi:circadian clock protein KaiC
MKRKPNSPQPLQKISSGIEGFDDITAGGLPRWRTTLLMGGPGCGKTVLALQMLVNGAAHHGMPGIFVAFEESVGRVLANAENPAGTCANSKSQLFSSTAACGRTW